jgi:Domain of unknown function (DUF5673)
MSRTFASSANLVAGGVIAKTSRVRENAMEWVIWYLVVLFVFLAGSYYMVPEDQMVGSDPVRRILHLIPWLLYGLAIPFLLVLPARISSLILNIVYVVFFGEKLVVWGFSKSETGALLAKIGRTSLGKLFIFLLDLSMFAFAIYLTWFFSTLVSNGIPKETSLGLEISRLMVVWLAFICCIAQSSKELEFRENGIFFRLSFVTWQKINSYSFDWNPIKSNNLTIRFKPRFPLFPESIMSMHIPKKHIDTVSHILAERLPGKRL